MTKRTQLRSIQNPACVQWQNEHSCVASSMWAMTRQTQLRSIQNPACVQWQDKHSCVASSMCAMTRQTQLRSIQHVCNDKTNTVAKHPACVQWQDKHSCEASSMCAMTRQTQLRSIQHVFKFKECHHPHPTPTHPTRRNCSLAMGSLTRPWAYNVLLEGGFVLKKPIQKNVYQ